MRKIIAMALASVLLPSDETEHNAGFLVRSGFPWQNDS